MIRFAVIGEIGSGKSYVAKQFGCPVFNADFEVAKLYKKDRKCFLKIKKALPNYISSFPVRKDELLNAIISNKSNLKKIIKIIHPKIRKKMNNFVKKNKNKKMVVLDIPLLIEKKINKKSDIIIFVDASKKDINRSLKKRKGFNQKTVNILKKFQLPVEVKKRKSNFIIKNNFDNSVKKNVKKVIGEIFK